MPMLKGSDPDVVKENIRMLRREGKPEKQAVAIALKLARDAKEAVTRGAKKVADVASDYLPSYEQTKDMIDAARTGKMR